MDKIGQNEQNWTKLEKDGKNGQSTKLDKMPNGQKSDKIGQSTKLDKMDKNRTKWTKLDNRQN